MHALYFTALFAVLHLLAFPISTQAAAALGINCHGSSFCRGWSFAQSLVTAIMDIDPNQWYNNGEHIACQGSKSKGYICAFLQHMPSGATGRDIQRLAHYITDHGCTDCGSVPFYFPSDNDISKGELTFNYVWANTATTPLSMEPSSATPPSPSSTTASPGPPSSNPQALFKTCSPCGHDTCTFNSNSSLPNSTYSLQLGSPVSNCQTGGDTNVTSTVGGSITLGDSWVVGGGGGVGLSLGPYRFVGINVQGSATGQWAPSQSFTESQSVTIQIPPGQKAVLIANVQYTQTGGSMQIHGKDITGPQEFPIISYQPITVIDITPEYVNCTSDFSANDLTALSCPSAATSFRADSVPRGSLFLMIVMVLLSHASLFLFV